MLNANFCFNFCSTAQLTLLAESVNIKHNDNINSSYIKVIPTGANGWKFNSTIEVFECKETFPGTQAVPFFTYTIQPHSRGTQIILLAHVSWCLEGRIAEPPKTCWGWCRERVVPAKGARGIKLLGCCWGTLYLICHTVFKPAIPLVNAIIVLSFLFKLNDGTLRNSKCKPRDCFQSPAFFFAHRLWFSSRLTQCLRPGDKEFQEFLRWKATES